MSRCTSFIEFDIPRVEFNSKLDIEQTIEESNNRIKDIKQEISMMCSANPNDILPKNSDYTPIEYIKKVINELFEELSDEYDLLTRAYLADYNYDTKIRLEDNWKTGLTEAYKGDEKEPYEYIYKDIHYTPEEFKEKNIEQLIEEDRIKAEEEYKEFCKKHNIPKLTQ